MHRKEGLGFIAKMLNQSASETRLADDPKRQIGLFYLVLAVKLEVKSDDTRSVGADFVFSSRMLSETIFRDVDGGDRNT